MTEKFTLILYGATSFVGRITARYLLENYGCSSNSDNGLRWAIAARSADKLAALKTELGEAAHHLPTLVADIEDPQSMARLASQADVIATTVGPYALYGEPVLKACVEAGTHYCDLTGEAHWIDQMQTSYETRAAATGARIVHCCGFDSIPSDLGVWYLQQYALQQYGAPCTRIDMFVTRLKGGISGGTVASLVNVVKAVKGNKDLRRKLANPYLLCPAGHGFSVRQPTGIAGYGRELPGWWGPFIMAAINTRIVLRSNALLHARYGNNFVYRETTFTGTGPMGFIKSQALAAGIGLLVVGLYLRPTRWLLQRWLLPAPGQGPSRSAQDKGNYELTFIGTTDNGDLLRTRVTGDKDPGYGSTAGMLAESALCLAHDVDAGGGFYTTAALMPDALIKRLTDNAGLTFTQTGNTEDQSVDGA